MNLSGLMAQVRIELDDIAKPYRWTDDELTTYINEAVNESCIRARLIFDMTTSDVCEIALKDGVSVYQLHEAVDHIARAATDNTVLESLTIEQLDDRGMNWENDRNEPIGYLRNLRNLVLYPKPNKDMTLRMRVYRLPLEPLAGKDDEPEIPAQHHFHLIYWACHLALMKRDTDAGNTQSANEHAAKFEAHFGPRPTASQQSHAASSRRHTTRYKPF